MTAHSEELLHGPNTIERVANTLPADGYRQLDRCGRWQRTGKRKRVPRLRLSCRAGIDERLRKGQEGERRDKEESVLDGDSEVQVQHARADHVEKAVCRFLAVADLGEGTVDGLEHEMYATSATVDGGLWSTNLGPAEISYVSRASEGAGAAKVRCGRFEGC